MSTASVRPKPPRIVSSAVILGIAVALSCGLGGGVFGEDVVGAVGRFTDHDESVLRLLGWCWGGLPFVLIAVLILVRRYVGAAARVVLTYVLVTWCASGALLIPSRNSSLEHRFGAAYPDARVLGFAWAAGVLPIFATGLLTIVGVLVVQKVFGPPDKKKLRSLSRALAVLWLLLTATGLVVALIGPLP